MAGWINGCDFGNERIIRHPAYQCGWVFPPSAGYPLGARNGGPGQVRTGDLEVLEVAVGLEPAKIGFARQADFKIGRLF